MEKSSKRLEKPSRVMGRVMSSAFDFKEAIVTLAGPRRHNDSKESMIARAASAARISFRAAKSFYYGETSGNPGSRNVERVRLALRLEEMRGHATQLEGAADALEAISPAVHGQSIGELRRAAGDIRDAIARMGGA